MPRPEKFTKAVTHRRGEDLAKARANWFRRSERPTETEIADDKALAVKMLRSLGLPRERQRDRRDEVVAELVALFSSIRCDWISGRVLQRDPSLSVLGGVQPTHAEMRDTIREGLAHADKLRDWYRNLPEGLLLRQTVPMTTPRPDHPRSDEPVPVLGVVIERLAETLAALAAQHDEKVNRGPKPGRRVAAQLAARWLFWFITRRAPEATERQRGEFVFRGMRGLGIDCPNLEDDQGDFARWFAEAEAIARPQPAAEAESEPGDDGEHQALIDRLREQPI